MSSSFANLSELVEGGPGNPLAKPGSSSALSADSSGARSEDRPDRLIIVSNQLPVRMKRRDGPTPAGAQHSWECEWDEDSLVGQAKAGIEQPQFQAIQVLYVGGLPHEVPAGEQDAVSSDLFSRFCCLPGAWPPRKAHAWPAYPGPGPCDAASPAAAPVHTDAPPSRLLDSLPGR